MAHLPTSRSDAWRRRLGPERVAAMVASVVVVLGGLGVASTMGASEPGVPRASAASVASATPSLRAAPTPVDATPQPTARRTPSPTAPPATVPPSSVPLDGQVQNPGFEATDPSPWDLALEAPAAASMTIDDTASAFEGGRSARIDITVPSDARTGISLRQAGIKVAQSHRYVCRVALRAAADREVRIRVASASGATYGTRLLTVGPTWTLVEFEFGSFVEDPSAVFEIDLGRSATTTWVDAVQITDVPESVP